MPKVNVVNFMANVDGKSWVHRLDPRTKLAMVVFFGIVPLLFTDYRFILFYLLLTLPLWVGAKLDFRPMAGAFSGVGFFLLIIFVLNAVRGPQELLNPDPLYTWSWYYQLGPIVVTDRTLLMALILALRLAGPATIGLLLMATTDPTSLGKGLRKLKVPTMLVFMVLAALRFIPIVFEQLFNILDAQLIRGASRSPIEQTKLMLLPLFITSLRRTRTMGSATESKGFGASRWNEFYQVLRLERLDKALLTALVVLTVVSLVLRFFGFGAAISLVTVSAH